MHVDAQREITQITQFCGFNKILPFTGFILNSMQQLALLILFGVICIYSSRSVISCNLQRLPFQNDCGVFAWWSLLYWWGLQQFPEILTNNKNIFEPSTKYCLWDLLLWLNCPLCSCYIVKSHIFLVYFKLSKDKDW